MSASESTGAPSPVPDSTLGELKTHQRLVTNAALAVAALAMIYVWYTGLIVFMSDSFLLANRAKHLAGEFNLNISHSASPALYPPLYSVFLSVLYLLHNPAAIFRGTLALQVVLTASQVAPLFLLLRQYGRLEPRPAAVLAAVIALSPATLPYTAMTMTEVLFCPLLLWLAYFLYRAWMAGDVLKFGTAGVLLALTLLTRNAATSVAAAFAATAVVQLLLSRGGPDGGKAARGGLTVAAVCCFGVYGLWRGFEFLFVHYENVNPVFDLPYILGIFTSFSRLDLHFNWLANCFFYLLFAPLSAAGAYCLALFLRRPALLRRDPLALFFVLCMVLSAAAASFVMSDFWGGPNLTWNRYMMPFVPFALLIAIRYRQLFNRAMLFTCAVILGLAAVAGRPSALACHFMDALILAGKQSPVPVAGVIADFLFFAIPVAAAWLWLRPGNGPRMAAQLTAVFWLVTHAAAAYAYRHSGDLNISAYDGAAANAFRIAQEKGSRAYYDPAMDLKDSFAAERILYYWPNLEIQPLPPDQLAKLQIPPQSSALYFSSNPVSGLQPLAIDRAAVRLYEILGRPTQPGQTAPRPGLSAIPGPNLPGIEMGDKDGRKVGVRWLGREADFYIDAPEGVAEADVQLTLGTFGAPRTAGLEVNGTPAGQTYMVEGDFWSTPPTSATFRVRLKPGRNVCRVTAPEPPSPLPDGRKVLFLLVGEIAVDPVSAGAK